MIQISKKLILQIQLEAEKAYPNECCGFLFGRIQNGEKYVEQLLSAVNSSSEAEQYHRFFIPPEEMLKAERSARSMKLDVIGFYHSHPDCPAVPSEYDTAHALPIYSYIIVSSMKGKAEAFTSWELDQNSNNIEFQSEIITISKGEIQ